MKNEKNGSKKKIFLTASILTASVSLIPLLYSSTYVASVWDVYGNTSHIPVAVVNEDSGSRYNDENVNFGNTLVEKLKENDNLQWHFVSADEANRGLTDNKSYYAVITIPSDFSENLTSATTFDKAQATIEYSANEKKNYVASMILKSAMSSLKDKIKTEEATKISDGLISKLNQVPDKLQTVEDGVDQLENGSNKLSSGFTDLISGSNLLTEKLFSLSNGLETARSGVNQLADASGNISVLADGANKLKNGTYTLSNGISQVTSSVGKLADGTSTLDSSVDALANGATSINTGLANLSTGINNFKDTLSQQIDASKTTSTNKVASGIDSAISSASNGIGSSIDSGVSSALETALGGSSLAATSISSYVNGVTSYIDSSQNYTKLPSAVSSYTEAVASYNSKVKELTAAIDSGDTGKIASLSGEIKTLSSQIDLATKNLKASSDSLENNADALSSAGNKLKSNGLAVASIPDTVKSQLEGKLADGLKTGINAALSNQLSPALKSSITDSMNSGLDTLSAGFDSGLNQIQTGISGINGSGYLDPSSTQPSLITGSKQLSAGLGLLKGGTHTLSTNMFTLSNIMNTQIEPGASKVYDASSQIADGSNRLTAMESGIKSLASGMDTATDGSLQLANGASNLNSGLKAASDGSNQLNSGLNTLNSGISDAISNTKEQLKLTDGLSNQAGNGIEIVSKPFDHVHNYGESFAPYFMNVSLWTGGLVALMTICFDFKRRLKTMGPDSNKPFIRFLAFCGISIAQAMLAGLVAQFGLGLNINHPGIFYAGLITIALTYTWIIEFFMLVFGDLGKMISMVVMVLQLTSTGGSFPIETSPAFFRALNPFLPMTYGIRLMKEAISGSNPGYAWQNLLIVLAFGLGGIALLFLGLGIKKIFIKPVKHTYVLKD